MRMQGISLTEKGRNRALDFLSGGNWPRTLAQGDAHWLADELLTVLRMQDPPQEDLAERLAEVAFRANTDPVIRDYIMQHLGHLWEQSGARPVIEETLWQAVDCGDETTPGSALIALDRGYQRDGETKNLAKVRQRAMELVQDKSTPLASRVTALAIAGEAGDGTAEKLATTLLDAPKTPLMLRKVAEHVLRR